MAPTEHDPPYVDAQALTDTDTHIYEAIATLEQGGRPVTQAAIAAAAGLDDDTVRQALRGLTERGVLVRTQPADVPVFELARRDWSAEARRPGRS